MINGVMIQYFEWNLPNDGNLWKQLKEKYQMELSALAYRPIPEENDVAKCFSELIKRIE